MKTAFVLELPVTEQDLAQLSAEGDATFFVSLAVDGQQKVVHVNLNHLELYDLIYSAAGIEKGVHKAMDPPFREGARLERAKEPDVGR